MAGGMGVVLIVAAVMLNAPSAELAVPTAASEWTPVPSQIATLTPVPSTPIPTLTTQEQERIEQLIAQLRSDDEAVTREASLQLSALGEKLNEEQVLEIVEIMRTGNVEWQRYLRRESHCTWYEYTTTKYYAADALFNMRSIYISDEIAVEVGDARASGKYTGRVFDPGWI